MKQDNSFNSQNSGHPISIAICDDNPEALIVLHNGVRKVLTDLNINSYTIKPLLSIESLENENTSFDLAFLDIEFGSGKNGIEGCDILLQRNPTALIIMVTAYSDYLDEALRHNAFRFLSKPLSLSRLNRAIRDALESLRFSVRIIHFNTAEGGLLIRTDEILSLETEGRYVLLHTVLKDISLKNTLTECMSFLHDSGFFQPHRSYLINLKYVLSYTHTEISLGLRIPSGVIPTFSAGLPYRRITALLSYRRYYRAFRAALIQYQEITR